MGGTSTRITGSNDLIAIDYTSEPLRRRNTQNYENDLSYIIDSAKKIAGHQAIKAVGIGTPGTPTPDRSRIETAVNIPHWNGQPLVEPISNALDCPVYYDNDAVTAGLGEAYYGSYQKGDFHYLIWGTGVGGATIERSENGGVVYAAKLLWKPHFKSWDCAGVQLGKDYGKPPETFTEKEWGAVLKKFGRHLLNYVETFHPPAIIFGGGLAAKHHEAVRLNARRTGIHIDVSKFGDDSGIIGSLGLIRYELDPNHRPYVYQEDPED